MSSYRDLATNHAQRTGIPPALFHALIQQESGWNPTARSPVGAAGLTQVMPDTARKPGYGVDPLLDPLNAEDNVRFGADYLAAMRDKYGGDWERALAAYNWGPGNADNWSGDMDDLPAETRGYISNIFAGLEDEYGTGPRRSRAEAGLPLVRHDARGKYGYGHARPGGAGVGGPDTASGEPGLGGSVDPTGRSFQLMQHGLDLMAKGHF